MVGYELYYTQFMVTLALTDFFFPMTLQVILGTFN